MQSSEIAPRFQFGTHSVEFRTPALESLIKNGEQIIDTKFIIVGKRNVHHSDGVIRNQPTQKKSEGRLSGILRRNSLVILLRSPPSLENMTRFVFWGDGCPIENILTT